MEKSDAVATLGEQAPALASLLRPAQVRAALKANDRLKLYLSVLQAAHAHAHHPREAALDLSREIAAADITVRAEADWLHDLPLPPPAKPMAPCACPICRAWRCAWPTTWV